MSKFKVGDKVRRVRGINKDFLASSGAVVTIMQISYDVSVEEWYLKFIEDNEDGWYADYYELVESAQESDIVFITTKEYESLKNRIVELEKQLESKNAWIPWNGGYCPVNPKTLVDVEFRDGDIVTGSYADNWRWTNTGVEADVVAYRIVKE